MIDDNQRGNVLVIGGGNGIGAATASLLAQRNWRVAIADKDLAGAKSVAERTGGEGFAIDVTDFAQLYTLIDEVEDTLGPVNALVVSSGAFQQNLPVGQLPIEEWKRIMSVNLDGAYYANRVVGLRMAARRNGSIVNIASAIGSGSTPQHIYGPSKAALINLTKCLAGEWGSSGVRVNSVSPGQTLVQRVIERLKTEPGRYAPDMEKHLALGRRVRPSEVAEAVEFLLSERASAITGVDIVVDAGWLVASLWEVFGGVRPPPEAPTG